MHEAGVALVSTGSTASKIAAAGVPVTKVEELTGFPECLDGRVKTCTPACTRGSWPTCAWRTTGASWPSWAWSRSTSWSSTSTLPRHRPVRCHPRRVRRADRHRRPLDGPRRRQEPPLGRRRDEPERYADVLTAARGGGFDLTARKRLAAEAFQHTAAYDVAVASWFTGDYAPEPEAVLPEFLAGAWQRKSTLRYGENPHQAAALYTDGQPGGIANAEQLHGKEMSFNNYVDTEAARRAAYDHDEPCVAIIKHANPCGIAVGADVAPPPTARRTPVTRSRRSLVSSPSSPR
ncbi:hypothetical protein ACFSNO_27810 [Streptomyces cirratus]